MPPYLAPLRLVAPALPAHCEPANDFLYSVSAAFHTCIPSNLALISTILGTCSIISWLFAQLPQIYKNHQLKSTSGLSIFFLSEWLLGDLSNLLGSLFTNQATWQVIIAGYYVFVDCALCGQWIWYELLHHGRPLRPIWGQKKSSGSDDGSSGMGGVQQVWDGVSVNSTGSNESAPHAPRSPTSDKKDDKKDGSPTSPGRNIPNRPNPMDAFRIPNFARSPSSKESWQNSPTLGTPSNRTITRLTGSGSPMPSPKTILYISLILAVLSNPTLAKPVSPFAPGPALHRTVSTPATISIAEASPSASEIAGKILSWMSTLLYLGSRLPQLYKNHVRKSTAGLSPTLFIAAFFGNFFYSTSLATNPNAWNDFQPGEGGGWVGPEGSIASEWILRALPFFLGAAGVLIMDAAVGCQFWYFGDNEPRGRKRGTGDDESVLTVGVNEDGAPRRRRFRWRRVSGWMRGWVPAVSVAGTPSVSRAATPAQTPREGSPGEARTQSISIPGQQQQGRALGEARALLGAGRWASPRSYGGVSPR
ncbi:hypothetical protein BS50DRAFT_634969 [Corynespora cassiicola Philippines]|uniref:PQ-loop-domain-containing protein n=1 Tax=Corynespora cassiicola Philippines TaxID=1448308 RepID=A0A2T2NK65_CORCC|nr:hypothetical protein BS50DRAFT_634969 [Corynespora cassiicola Philippines]